MIGIGTVFMLSNNPIGTSLNVDIDSPVYINDTISIKLFNNESNPLANKTINLTLKNSKKEYVKSIKTNEKGLLNISSISQMKLQIKCFIFRRKLYNFLCYRFI